MTPEEFNHLFNVASQQEQEQADRLQALKEETERAKADYQKRASAPNYPENKPNNAQNRRKTSITKSEKNSGKHRKNKNSTT